jgi:hypothetical protein
MTDEAMSPSRRRMIEDTTIRKFAPKTQHDIAIRRQSIASDAVHPSFTCRTAVAPLAALVRTQSDNQSAALKSP